MKSTYLLIKISLCAAALIAPALYAQSDSTALVDPAQAEESAEGLVVYEIKSQDYVESTVVHRGEGKLVDYYDQSRQDRGVFSAGELSSTPQLRKWKLNK